MTTEAIEHAQQTTGKVTAKGLLQLVRNAKSGLSLHGTADPSRGSWSNAFIFEVVSTARDRKAKTETRVSLSVPGSVHHGYTDAKKVRTPSGFESHYSQKPYETYSETYKPLTGFWYLSGHNAELIDVLELLPSGAEVSFSVCLDAGTTQNHTDANMHGDFLYLNADYMVRGKLKTRRFLIDTSTGRHNSARFGQGGVYR